MQTETRIIPGDIIFDWKSTGKLYHWPERVAVEFPDGEVWDQDGGIDREGNVIDDNPRQITVGGSPCHAAMVAAGIELVEVD